MTDWFFGLMSAEQWETWRNWLATIGGLVALLIAAFTFQRNVRIKREEQARLIYSKVLNSHYHTLGDVFDLDPDGQSLGIVGGNAQIIVDDRFGTDNRGKGIAFGPVMNIAIVIHNGSKELIGPARVQLANGATREVWNEVSIGVAEIEPETDKLLYITYTNPAGDNAQHALATTLIFRDASGQWWRRYRSEPIERVHNDPENQALPKMERELHSADLVSRGYPAIEDPKVPLGARWHRFWRVVRGKPPLP